MHIPTQRTPERQTVIAAPFSLHNRAIILDGMPIGRPASGDVRFVEVAAKPDAPALIGAADSLEEHRLVLGGSVGLGARGGKLYQIPVNARPLRHELPSFCTDPAAYTDASMMRDLGDLTARVARLTGGRIVAHPAEEAFGLVDFVGQGDRQLFLLPGVEHYLSEAPVAGDAETQMQAQMQAFGPEFSTRFGANVQDFVQGYNDSMVHAGV